MGKSTGTPSCSWKRKDGSNYKAKSGWSRFKQRTNESDEWDLRVDVGETWEVEDLIKNISGNIGSIVYAFISGVETPDKQFDTLPGQESYVNRNSQRSENNHVHVGIIFKRHVTRDIVCRTVLSRDQNDLPAGAVYCTPRAQHYSYGGWVAHHGKNFTKLVPTETNMSFEYGILPVEDFNTVADDFLERWINTIKRYATPYWTTRLHHYFEQQELRELDRMETDDDEPKFLGCTIRGVNDSKQP